MKIDFKNITIEKVMVKYYRIVAHLIAESLGYFTPESAAIAIIKAKQDEPYYCEWYTDCAGKFGDRWDKENVSKITREMLESAIRHRHKGYMSDYKRAISVVNKAIKGNNPIFASWF